MNFLIVILGKFISWISKLFNLGNGSTWPGHIALGLNANFLNDYLNKDPVKTVLIVGTNGKTTTTKLLETILEGSNKRVMINRSGANLLNGVASSIIIDAKINGELDKDFALLEIDENVLPLVLEKITPDYIIALNLFRDQLDRYGEINSISKKWKDSISKLKNTILILNADDPQIAYLGNESSLEVKYFGLNDVSIENPKLQHASDSTLCPKCGNDLQFEATYFSHLGKWRCEKCGFARPSPDLTDIESYPLTGTYARYDCLAAVLFSRTIGISDKDINNSLKNFIPAFGRQEKVSYEGKNIQFFLSKNPTSFNESLRTINQSNPKNLLIILNDRIPDGTDVSWIWDVDFETLVNKNINLYLAGDRVYDLALRIKYSGKDVEERSIFEDLDDAISYSLDNTKQSETLFILPTYSGMLDARKILTGKKIL